MVFIRREFNIELRRPQINEVLSLAVKYGISVGSAVLQGSRSVNLGYGNY